MRTIIAISLLIYGLDFEKIFNIPTAPTSINTVFIALIWFGGLTMCIMQDIKQLKN